MGYVFSFPRNSSPSHTVKLPKSFCLELLYSRVLLQTWRFLQSSPYAQIIASVKEQQQSAPFSPKTCQSETYFEQFPAHPTDQKPQRDIVTYMPSSFSSTVYICLPHMACTTLSFQILIHSDQHEVTYVCTYIYIYIYRNNIHTFIHIISYSITTLLKKNAFLFWHVLRIPIDTSKNATRFNTHHHRPNLNNFSHLQGATRISNHRIH